MYPEVMIMLTVLTICLDAVGGLAVATTLPAKTLNGNLSYGVIETFENIYVNHFGEQYRWIVFVVALLLALGVFAEISAWIVGPSKALLEAAYDGILPARFEETNKNGVSVFTIMLQAVIVTIWDAVLCGSIALAGGSDSSVGYLTAIGLTVVIYLAAYVLFFLGYFVLVFKKKDLKRTYNVPGKTVGKTIIGGIGFILSVFALLISFVPPASIAASEHRTYQIILLISFVVTVLLPFIIYEVHDKSAHTTIEEPTHVKAEDVNPAVYPAARGEHHVTKNDEHILKH